MENMEFKGTKGKWQLYHHIDDNEKNQYSVTSDNGKMAYCYEMCIADYDNSTAKANAQLISKAPEMLEALKYSLRMLKNNKSVADYQYIENLIKEATDIDDEKET